MGIWRAAGQAILVSADSYWGGGRHEGLEHDWEVRGKAPEFTPSGQEDYGLTDLWRLDLEVSYSPTSHLVRLKGGMGMPAYQRRAGSTTSECFTRACDLRGGGRVYFPCSLREPAGRSDLGVRLEPPRRSAWVEVDRGVLHFLKLSSQRLELEEQGIRAAYLAYHCWLDRNARVFKNSRVHPRWTEDDEASHGDRPLRVDRGIGNVEMASLIRPVLAQEVQEAVWALAADKAPGPDGFPPFFFRKYWGIIHRGVVEAIQCFFAQAAMPEDWKATFITLIPKRQDAVEPSHFRPISLCTTLYKVVAKIMVGRMKPLLPGIISHEQGAFVAGRNISHNILLAQEMMWDLLRASKRRSLMAIKLDMERAYDRIKWSFLKRALEAYSFHRQWIGWVMGCIRGPKFSILINGTPTLFFESTLGLRQGCPLSPYLFIICADILSRTLQRVCADRELEAYIPAPGARPLSHLFFADDCLLLTRARVTEARALRRVVTEYCMESGQRVNFMKSAITFSPSTDIRVRQEIRGILQIPEQEGTLTYLGVPISGRRPRVAECSSLVQRVQSRLEGWTASSLSMMGRLTLIRSVLGSIPLYLMAHTVIPKTTLLRIERLLRSFLWGSHGGGHGVHLVAWEQVCRPTSEGGLGVQSLMGRREALIARHAARFLLEPHSLWSQVMAARYGRGGLEGVWRGRRVSFMWREIGRYLLTASANTRWLIGDGRSIDVTSEPWVDTLPLRRWPIMVSIEAAEGLRVCDLLAAGGAEWDDARLRQLFGVHLAARIRSIPLPGCAGSDVRVWGTSSRARVRLGDLTRVIQPEQDRGPDCAWIWRYGLHPRVALFLWKVFWDRLPTRVALSRRGWGIPAECGTCGAAESVDHVLFQCIWARLTWQWAGVPQEARSERLQFLHTIRQWLASTRTSQEAIRATCTAHQIWLARNARTLGDRRVSPRFAAERARVQASEIMPTHSSDRPLTAQGTWGPPSASAAHQMI
ncbi:uncharacterized protein LOC120110939 [Phoenix dactylifera]|uniref:Uncharacterized protein LOC120110939 n=1 Tax=Phoenix dactylifera TaxID=42345 RepID=A0A8B9A8D6_PHODC|nr:uncharacterized protein LOC120110939 [Phoenix dactylifera]